MRVIKQKKDGEELLDKMNPGMHPGRVVVVMQQ